MAIFKFHLLFLLSLLSLFLQRPVLSNHEEEILLKGINDYRISLNLTTLTYNDNAECLAEEITDLFKHQPCTSGPASVPGFQPGFPGFLHFLTKCELNVNAGDIMPACVPDLEASLVLSKFTKSRYNKNLNDSKFTGIGIASDDDWIVVILTTSTSTNSGDEEEILLTGINDYRTSLNLTTLTYNDNAECLAEEITDLFKHQPCTYTSGPATVPGFQPGFPGFLHFLTKCELNVTAGDIMPACVPDLDASLVLSSFTKSRYNKNLNDSKFTGIGIASDDNWIVVILTTTTSEDGSSPDRAGSN